MTPMHLVCVKRFVFPFRQSQIKSIITTVHYSTALGVMNGIFRLLLAMFKSVNVMRFWMFVWCAMLNKYNIDSREANESEIKRERERQSVREKSNHAWRACLRQ